MVQFLAPRARSLASDASLSQLVHIPDRKGGVNLVFVYTKTLLALTQKCAL